MTRVVTELLDLDAGFALWLMADTFVGVLVEQIVYEDAPLPCRLIGGVSCLLAIAAALVWGWEARGDRDE